MFQSRQVQIITTVATGGLFVVLDQVDAAGKNTPVPPQEAGIWLFGEAVPAGVINNEEAGLIMKSIGLAQGNTVPENLVEELAQDATRFVNG